MESGYQCMSLLGCFRGVIWEIKCSKHLPRQKTSTVCSRWFKNDFGFPKVTVATAYRWGGQINKLWSKILSGFHVPKILKLVNFDRYFKKLGIFETQYRCLESGGVELVLSSTSFISGIMERDWQKAEEGQQLKGWDGRRTAQISWSQLLCPCDKKY